MNAKASFYTARASLRAALVASIACLIAPTLRAVDLAAEDAEEYDEYAMPQVSDPLEKFNRTIFKFNGAVTVYVLTPVSNGYTAVVPKKAREGIGNFFSNLAFPLRFTGSLLQGKLDRSAAETGKFLVNSTVGLGGFLKVSDHVPELRVPDEDIGQAFGVWGLGHGPYLVIPVLGPASLRDGLGRICAIPLNPMRWEFAESMDWTVRDGSMVLETVNGLPATLENLDRITRSAVDPYVAVRNGYIQYRDAEVKK
ncbi:VacJ family lipoprotein [Opitutales bacterium ASA1]|uniref:MlaA family lipoprotein n=1 Tax=Congregicoccus parvus TaxID=3081749 RepID=UPI002B2E22AB|nr:VacJ family lipoprotein [Opitutales bacterium ASA1]